MPTARTAQHVAVVNQAFARKFYGGTNPVGRYINKDTEIVGEVADVSVSSGLYAGAPLMTEQAMYIPAAQVPAQYPRVGARMVSAGLDCPHGRPGGRIDRGDAAGAGECRPEPALLGLLQHERSAGADACDPAHRSGVCWARWRLWLCC